MIPYRCCPPEEIPSCGLYATELHLHIKGTSGCARSGPDELMPIYRDRGYTTVVVTNHYGPWSAMTTGKSGRDAIDLLRHTYECVAEEADRYGLTALSGVEISFSAHQGDFLLYGFDWDFFYDRPDIYDKMTVHEFAPLAHENGFFMIQAHPCRVGNTPRGWEVLDGVEVHNGQYGADGHNDRTLALAREKGMRMTSGSDCHGTESAARGGILTKKPIRTMPELMATLRAGGYGLIVDPAFFPMDQV